MLVKLLTASEGKCIPPTVLEDTSLAVVGENEEEVGWKRPSLFIRLRLPSASPWKSISSRTEERFVGWVGWSIFADAHSQG